MGIFAGLALGGRARRDTPGQGAGVTDGLVGDARSGGCARFQAVGELLASGRDPRVACSEAGRKLARDGADLGEALHGLRSTWQRVLGGDPDFGAVQELCVAWGEETLGYVHQLSCDDPLTGLATRGHLRARLSEVHRAAEQRGESVATTHALVVLDLPLLAQGTPDRDPFDAAWSRVRLAETARLAFPGEEVISEVRSGRLVILAERGDLLARRVGLLRDLVEDLGPDMGRVRAWIEGLPATGDAAAWTLDEIARG